MAATAIDMMLQTNGFQSKKKEDGDNKDNLWYARRIHFHKRFAVKYTRNSEVIITPKCFDVSPRVPHIKDNDLVAFK